MSKLFDFFSSDISFSLSYDSINKDKQASFSQKSTGYK